ncbi:hypothetical protein C8J57DRAFT_1472233 [Mycena rebaudengoi]|nr:hypothetical protein C8J57DRAFT_1472233 [Mycena rebaudengoi]
MKITDEKEGELFRREFKAEVGTRYSLYNRSLAVGDPSRSPQPTSSTIASFRRIGLTQRCHPEPGKNLQAFAKDPRYQEGIRGIHERHDVDIDTDWGTRQGWLSGKKGTKESSIVQALSVWVLKNRKNRFKGVSAYRQLRVFELNEVERFFIKLCTSRDEYRPLDGGENCLRLRGPFIINIVVSAGAEPTSSPAETSTIYRVLTEVSNITARDLNISLGGDVRPSISFPDKSTGYLYYYRGQDAALLRARAQLLAENLTTEQQLAQCRTIFGGDHWRVQPETIVFRLRQPFPAKLAEDIKVTVVGCDALHHLRITACYASRVQSKPVSRPMARYCPRILRAVTHSLIHRVHFRSETHYPPELTSTSLNPFRSTLKNDSQSEGPRKPRAGVTPGL